MFFVSLREICLSDPMVLKVALIPSSSLAYESYAAGLILVAT